MRMYEIISRKRDGGELSCDELGYFVKGLCDGSIPDYQVAALLMAIFIRGLNERETTDLTLLMADSGDRIDLSSIPGTKVDKHSTGGVGDKTTLVVAPIVAACGVPVAKMSGRSLGHTGGTIDKLESIPGFQTSLTVDEFIRNVREAGICIASQTGRLAPADKKLYAIRDMTATVESIPLIASSIMSKKLASGADGIVLDVKTGSGAFMKTYEESVKLATAMVGIGTRAGKKTVAVITDMDAPLGNSIGNSLEVIEAIETLKGKGPYDLELVSVELAARMLEIAEMGDIQGCRLRAKGAIDDGSALLKLKEMIEKQGGDKRAVEDYGLFGKTDYVFELMSDRKGYVARVDAELLGRASMMLGAGRKTKESPIDHSTGVIMRKKTGEAVKEGDVLASLYANDKNAIDTAAKIVSSAYVIEDTPSEDKPLILAFIDSSGIKRMWP